MALQLYKNSAIQFMAAKNFTYAGVDYQLGDDFPQEEANNIETLVRARYIIPVVDDWGDKPRHWYRHVRLRSEVMNKLHTNQGSHLLNREKQIELDSPTPVNTKIRRQRSKKLTEKENEEMAKHEVTYVDGKEESEPVSMLGLDVDEPNDIEVETKVEDEPEVKLSDYQQALLDGKSHAEASENRDPDKGSSVDGTGSAAGKDGDKEGDKNAQSSREARDTKARDHKDR